MPLHPDLDAFLDLMDTGFASGRPLMHEMSIDHARAEYDRASQTIDQSGDEVGAIQSIEIPSRDQQVIAARLYIPKPVSTAPEAWPALLYFHGGGYCIGGLESHDSLCRAICQRAQSIVIAVDYRLAPEHKFPTAFHDAEDAYLWLALHAADFAIDPSRVAVGGDSAGGTLAATLAITAKQAGWQQPLLQILLYPCTSSQQDTPSHRALAEGYMLEAETLQWMFGNYLRSPQDRLDWRFAPLQAQDIADIAPAWIALAEFDLLRDEGIQYAEKLKQAGVTTTLKIYPSMIHDFARLGNIVPDANQLRDDIAQVLTQAFAAVETTSA